MKTTKLTARDRAEVRRRAAIEAYEAGYRAWPETSARYGAEYTSTVLRNLAEAMVEAIQADVQAEMSEAEALAELLAAQEALKVAEYRSAQAGTAFPDAVLLARSALAQAETAEALALFRLGEVRA